MVKAIINARVFTDLEIEGRQWLENQAVVIDGKKIIELVPMNQFDSSITVEKDLEGNRLIPGFIDLQVNGGGGIMLNNAPTVDTIKTMMAGHRKFGTTGMMPTLITTSYNVMTQAIAAVEQAIVEGVPGILGIHLEGPFLSPHKKGAHDQKKFRSLDTEGLALVASLKNGKTIATIAPELCDDDSIRELVDKGVIVCAGHSNATYEQMVHALELGVSGFTHLYNGMTPLASRDPGLVGAALDDKHSWFGIIADGYHSHPVSFRLAVNAKQQGGAILVTDSMATVGSDDNHFVLDGETISAIDGRCANAAGSLAGSALDMLSGVNNACEFAQISWEEAVRMATVYPAAVLGLDDQMGRIAPGYMANMLALSGPNQLQESWIDGVSSAASDRRSLDSSDSI